MTIQLLFFGAITDVTGSNHQVFKTEEQMTVAGLNSNLKLTFPALATHTYKIALNKIIAEPTQTINEGDEVAFLPPFAGG